jgi:ribosomal protein S18 acetylase RimI-like enzyme
MTTPARVKQEAETGHEDAIAFGLARKEDLDAAARIYLENFPQYSRQFFRRPAHAAAFYRDLMELMRICYGPTFFAAWEGNRLVGFLILTLPGRNTIGPALREGFLWRAAGHALTGKYGAAFRLFLHAGGALSGFGSGSPGRHLAGLPHVYVLAVASGYTGRGIGRELQERARQACTGKFDAMCLYVERENDAAIRFYERVGFRIIHSDTGRHAMMWKFQTTEKKNNSQGSL